MSKKGYVKWIALGLVVLYVLSPIDLIPDAIPIIGSTDDAFVVLVGFLLREYVLK